MDNLVDLTLFSTPKMICNVAVVACACLGFIGTISSATAGNQHRKDVNEPAGSWLDSLHQANEEAQQALFQAFVPSFLAKPSDSKAGNIRDNSGAEPPIDFAASAPPGVELRQRGHDMGSDLYEDFFGFFHAIDWTEPFILTIGAFHVGVILVAVGVSRSPIGQTVLFLCVAATILCAPVLNEACMRHITIIARQPYCDEAGAFISLLVSLPLLVVLCGVAISWCVEASSAASELGALRRTKENSEASNPVDLAGVGHPSSAEEIEDEEIAGRDHGAGRGNEQGPLKEGEEEEGEEEEEGGLRKRKKRIERGEAGQSSL